MIESTSAQIVVVGNEKGGCGKSTTAVHLIAGLALLGRSVASLDLDHRQRTLSRYLDNRRAFCAARGYDLPMSVHQVVESAASIKRSSAESGDGRRLEALVAKLATKFDAIVIDTAGGDSVLGRTAHGLADTLVTPLNDSLLDLDLLCRLEGETPTVKAIGHYAEMVGEKRRERAERDGGVIDWIVMRNRLSSLDAANKRTIERLLRELAARIDFRIVSGFGERVIFRELFHKGLTLLDLREADPAMPINSSRAAAQQEVRAVIGAVRYKRPMTARHAAG